MKCEKCKKNEATMHITKIVDGVQSEMHLCAECASELSGESKYIGAADFLSSFFDPVKILSTKKTVTCPKCGMSYYDFTGSGYLGCSACYDTFKDSLPSMLQRMHGKTRHVGKIPKGFDGAEVKAREYEKLKDQLRSAIDEERYEDAAKIRDSLKRLENEQNNSKGEEKNGK